MMTISLLSMRTRSWLLCAALLGHVPQVLADDPTCTHCLEIKSVYHAAGEDPATFNRLREALMELEFKGTRLTSSSEERVRNPQLRSNFAKLPSKVVLELRIAADRNLGGAAAAKQASARADEVSKTLRSAGISPGKFRITWDGRAHQGTRSR